MHDLGQITCPSWILISQMRMGVMIPTLCVSQDYYGIWLEETGHRKALWKDECAVQAGGDASWMTNRLCPSILHFRCCCYCFQYGMLEDGPIANSRARTWPADCTCTCCAKGTRVHFYVSIPDRQIILLWNKEAFLGEMGQMLRPHILQNSIRMVEALCPLRSEWYLVILWQSIP